MRSLQRWDPFAELNMLHSQVNSLFNDTFGNLGESHVAPATDVYSDEKGITIEAHLPNFKEDEITVNQLEDALEIKAEHEEKQEENEKKGRKYMLRQSVSQYYRRFALPRNADVSKIDADFENGILKVNVPFKELPAPKQIAIGSGKHKK